MNLDEQLAVVAEELMVPLESVQALVEAAAVVGRTLSAGDVLAIGSRQQEHPSRAAAAAAPRGANRSVSRMFHFGR